MSLLQCFGYRTRQTQYFNPISSTQTPTTVDRNTTHIIDKARKLAVKVDRQFGNSMNGLDDMSRSRHEDNQRTQTPSNVSVELLIRLNRLQNRSERFKKYLRETPSNTSKYDKLQAQDSFIRQQIRHVRTQIAQLWITEHSHLSRTISSPHL